MDTNVTSARRNADVSRIEVQRHRSALRTRLHELQEELADSHALLDELSFSRDKEAIQLRGLTRRTELHVLASIDDVEQALARLDNGTYTQCVRCGGEIGDSRLDALPTTRHCVVCASTARKSV